MEMILRSKRRAEIKAEKAAQNREQELQEQLDALVKREKELEAQIKELDAQKKAQVVEIKKVMKEWGKDQQRSGLFTVFYKMTNPSPTFNSKKYLADHPTECAPYMEPGKPQEYFRIQ